MARPKDMAGLELNLPDLSLAEPPKKAKDKQWPVAGY
jgi:hypothetical protein